jgi:hypothetical protein
MEHSIEKSNISKLTTNIKSNISKITSNMSSSSVMYMFIYIICILIILIPVSYYIYAATTQSKSDCSNFDIMFNSKNTYITSIDASFNQPLRNYYIKSAYNCCCPGNYKNDAIWGE